MNSRRFLGVSIGAICVTATAYGGCFGGSDDPELGEFINGFVSSDYSATYREVTEYAGSSSEVEDFEYEFFKVGNNLAMSGTDDVTGFGGAWLVDGRSYLCMSDIEGFGVALGGDDKHPDPRPGCIDTTDALDDAPSPLNFLNNDDADWQIEDLAEFENAKSRVVAGIESRCFQRPDEYGHTELCFAKDGWLTYRAVVDGDETKTLSASSIARDVPVTAFELPYELATFED